MLAAWKLIEPELPAPAWVMLAVTPLGNPVRLSVTLPVKLVREMDTLAVCAWPPCVSVMEEGLTWLIAMLTGAVVTVKEN